ncbi:MULTISPECIES: acyl carrier protein [unclassified Streptomyces]|uniref:acyl carrier protein n=1 Tax=unclassified Streptomyces TaxID=2593676 RepID=UPI00378FAD30
MGTTVPVDVEASVRQALVAELGIEADSVAGDDELSLLPGMESVKLLRIVSALEEVHGVSLDDDALFSIDTVDDLVQVLRGGRAADETAAESGP